MWERKAKVITMSKSVSETLKEQGVVLTDAPNFENSAETSEKNRVEKALEMTNTNISKKCRKAFKKFTSKYNLDIDFEKFEEKSDELMELVNAVATDDEDASLVRHMKSYCKSVLKNLSKLPKEDVITGINGEVITEKEVKEFVDVMDKMDSDKVETTETAGNTSKNQAEEKVEKEDKVETKKEPEISATKKKTLTMPMMSDYIKAGKVNQYARDLEAYFLQRA